MTSPAISHYGIPDPLTGSFPAGFIVTCAGRKTSLSGGWATTGCVPSIVMESCSFMGPGLVFDMRWVQEVPGLEHIRIRNLRLEGGEYGRAELMPLLEGRRKAVIAGCRICSLPVDGTEGKPGVCPDDLAVRCVLSS